MTAAELHMSELKCRASAASASLAWASAAWRSARERFQSIMIEPTMMATAHQVTATSFWPAIRRDSELIDDPGGGEEQETGLDQRRDAFGLGMAEMMRVVRRPVGEAHRRIGDGRGTEIDERMHCLRQDRQGTGDEAGDEFGGGEERACRERNQRHSLLVGYHASPPFSRRLAIVDSHRLANPALIRECNCRARKILVSLSLGTQGPMVRPCGNA